MIKQLYISVFLSITTKRLNRLTTKYQLFSMLRLSVAENKNRFNYEAFYEEKLKAKKADNSYRVFKKVSRCASKFPSAMEHSAVEPQGITVWCSNDYMGMTRHPTVQQAVM